MTPRTLTATGKDAFRHVEKMKRRAQAQADRDQAEFAVIRHDGLVFVRPLVRARRLAEKHREAEILAVCRPGAVTP